MTDLDSVLYLKHAGRGWAIWLSPNDELNAIPDDEEEFSEDDLLSVEQYLYNEGFFSEHYARRMKKMKDDI